jgi:uncharacterized membrane protein
MTAIEKETTMMCSKDFERCVQCMDCRGVERNAPSQQESTITRKKMVAAHVALIAAILMAPTHEALARVGGGFGGGHGGSFGGGLHGGAGLGRGFRADDLRAGGNRELEFGGRGFAHRAQVGDPYWSPCDYSSTYGTNGCGG